MNVGRHGFVGTIQLPYLVCYGMSEGRKVYGFREPWLGSMLQGYLNKV